MPWFDGGLSFKGHLLEAGPQCGSIRDGGTFNRWDLVGDG